MHRRRPVQEKPVQKWLGNNIPIFRKNVTALKNLEELVEELAASCTYEPAGSNNQGIRQNILNTLKVTSLLLDGEICTQPLYIFRKWLARIVQPIYYTGHAQRCLDRIFRKVWRPKFVTRKCKIENNDKEIQFQTLQKAPARRAYEEERTFHQELEKEFTWLQFDESQKQRFAPLIMNFPPSRNMIERKCK